MIYYLLFSANTDESVYNDLINYLNMVKGNVTSIANGPLCGSSA